MSDEPLYCPACGREHCGCSDEAREAGRYCEACGVIPAPGKECRFYKEGGQEGCES